MSFVEKFWNFLNADTQPLTEMNARELALYAMRPSRAVKPRMDYNELLDNVENGALRNAASKLREAGFGEASELIDPDKQS